MQGGDLHDALHVGKSRLEWKSGGCRLAAQIALGLSKLHARKVCILACAVKLHIACALVEGALQHSQHRQATQNMLVCEARGSEGTGDCWLCTGLSLSWLLRLCMRASHARLPPHPFPPAYWASTVHLLLCNLEVTK